MGRALIFLGFTLCFDDQEEDNTDGLSDEDGRVHDADDDDDHAEEVNNHIFHEYKSIREPRSLLWCTTISNSSCTYTQKAEMRSQQGGAGQEDTLGARKASRR